MQVLVALIICMALFGYIAVPVVALCSSEFRLVRCSINSPMRILFMLFLLFFWPVFLLSSFEGRGM